MKTFSIVLSCLLAGLTTGLVALGGNAQTPAHTHSHVAARIHSRVASRTASHSRTHSRTAENRLRIMSYNTHNCIGHDGSTNYDRIASIILDAAPDIAALQELDSMTTRNNHYVLGELARRTNMHATYAPAIDYRNGRYGIGILSKQKPIDTQRIPLPGREEKRVLLIAEFDNYFVACTHFSLTEEDRAKSVEIILRAVEGVAKPLFLAGDMNDTPNTGVQKQLTEKFTILNDPAQPTFGSGTNSECIDYIYSYNNSHLNGTTYSVVGRRVIPEEIASDHRPVLVELIAK